MPTQFHNVRQNFSAGVLTPRYALRVETEAYVRGLREGKNFIISTQGGAQYRNGFEFINYAASNQPFRLFQFHRGGDVSDILIEVSEGVIRFWIEDSETGETILYQDLETLLVDETTGDDLIDESDGAELVYGTITAENPYELDELETVYFTNQDKFGILCHRNHPPLYITLRRDGQVVTETLPLERIPLIRYNDVNAPAQEAQSASWRISFAQAWFDFGYVYSVYYNGVVATDIGGPIDYTFSQTNATNATNIEAGLTAAAAAQGFTTTFVVTAVTDLVYDVVVSGPDSGYDVRITPTNTGDISQFLRPLVEDQTVSQPSDQSTTDPVEEPAWSYPTTVLHNGRYYSCKLVHTSALTDEPGVGDNWDEFWNDLGIAVPPGFDYQYPSGNAWVVDTIYAPWGRGFPTVCIFHDQRLILMANPDNPTALYGSAIARYQSFIPGPNDDDPFIFVLDSSDTPQIKWARSQSNLILGTSSGEWNITAEVTITPTDIQADQQNRARSLLQIPVQVDTEIFYIEQGGRTIRVSQYQRRRQAFSSENVSSLAEHLISTEGVKRMIASYVPEVFMVMLRNNGQPVFMTFDKTQVVLAFTECETDGFCNDVASYFSLFNNRDYAYFATQRNNNYSIEKFRYPCGKVTNEFCVQEVVHMDGWVNGIMDGPVITGLEHLELKQVGVLIDDAWQIGDFTVKAGQITLDPTKDWAGKRYTIGLLYEGVLETFEMIDNVQGTGLGTKRRWNQLSTRILNSALPKVYGKRSEDRTPSTPMNQAETIREGVQDVEQSVYGYSDASIKIVMDRPYPMHVLGFFGEYQVESR